MSKVGSWKDKTVCVLFKDSLPCKYTWEQGHDGLIYLV